MANSPLSPHAAPLTVTPVDKIAVDKLTLIAPSLRQAIRQRDGFPVLNRWLESSVAGLHFAGALADQSYGPICRFVSGADVAARRITAFAARIDRT